MAVLLYAFFICVCRELCIAQSAGGHVSAAKKRTSLAAGGLCRIVRTSRLVAGTYIRCDVAVCGAPSTSCGPEALDVASHERARTQGPDAMKTRHGAQGRRGSDRGCSLVKGGPGRRARRQAARAETRENAGSGRMNENRLSRVLFNNKSCRLRGAANEAMTRIRMASQQDEEEE